MYSVAKERSSSSHLMVFIPRRWASGARISSVSRAFCSCFSGARNVSVRMLCSRSASLMTSTRGSLAIATTILRMVSALAASPSFTLSSLVTPSTRSATSPPNSSASSSSVYSVSSTVSCSSAATSVFVSMPSSARIEATASGCVMYGSPDLRNWPLCSCSARVYACWSSRTSARGWAARWVATRGSRTSGSVEDCQGALNRARRARMRRPVGGPTETASEPEACVSVSEILPSGPAARSVTTVASS